ncbi:MAG: hypothetical protein AAFV95_28135 [Bacteroidota bacterium]
MNRIYLLIVGAILSILLFADCGKKTCKQCVKCFSYDSQATLINEVRECSTDTNFLNGFELGFIDGANQQGWDAICLKDGISCD